jgi:hypothetical protein
MASGHRDEAAIASSALDLKGVDAKREIEESTRNTNSYPCNDGTPTSLPQEPNSSVLSPEDIRVGEPRGKFRILAIMLALSVS